MQRQRRVHGVTDEVGAEDVGAGNKENQARHSRVLHAVLRNNRMSRCSTIYIPIPRKIWTLHALELRSSSLLNCIRRGVVDKQVGSSCATINAVHGCLMFASYL